MKATSGVVSVPFPTSSPTAVRVAKRAGERHTRIGYSAPPRPRMRGATIELHWLMIEQISCGFHA